VHSGASVWWRRSCGGGGVMWGEIWWRSVGCGGGG
jgi:hypothetical protein